MRKYVVSLLKVWQMSTRKTARIIHKKELIADLFAGTFATIDSKTRCTFDIKTRQGVQNNNFASDCVQI
jgi:hypothetical protein